MTSRFARKFLNSGRAQERIFDYINAFPERLRFQQGIALFAKHDSCYLRDKSRRDARATFTVSRKSWDSGSTTLPCPSRF